MDDYISRKTVIDFFNQVIKTHTIGQSRQIVARAFENAKVVFEAIEPADVRPVVRGHFGKHISPFTAPCSECGASMNMRWNYCPNCGADMRPEPPEREVEA